MGNDTHYIALTDAQRLDWLRLFRSENIGPRTFRSLLNHYGGAKAALEALPGISNRSGKIIHICSIADAEKEMSEATALGVRFIALGEKNYPHILGEIADPPPLIAVRGNENLLLKTAIAIVGSRNASVTGLRMTEILAAGLGKEGYCIVSGLARGIDAKAHEISLSTGTIAVLAGGYHHIYPQEHEALAARIVDLGGLLLSEMPIGWTPRGRDFPRRNRIVSGLSIATVIVEAARKSGSLITARFALEQGREVFAVPGSPLDPRSAGTNDLIRQGANVALEVEDICTIVRPLLSSVREETGLANKPLIPLMLEEPLWDELDLAYLSGESFPNKEITDPKATHFAQSSSPYTIKEEEERSSISSFQTEARILEMLSSSPIEISELARLTTIPVRNIRAIAIELDIQGHIEWHGGDRISLRLLV